MTLIIITIIIIADNNDDNDKITIIDTIMIVSDQREHCTEETSGLWQVQHQQVGTISDLKFHILPSDLIFYIHFPFIL